MMFYGSSSLFSFFIRFSEIKDLTLQLVKQEIRGRYQGSFLGIFWAFLVPVFMLAVYTFVFSVVFQSKWGGELTGGKVGFAIFLFTGLIAYSFFAECVNRAPTMMVQNPNYIKKVLFPLEVIPLAAAGGAFFHLLVNVFVLLVLAFLVGFSWHWTILLLPFVLLPLFLLTLGLSWFFASLGVYVRDIAPVVSIFVSALLFLSPVFYPLSALPETFQSVVQLSPLTGIIEMMRALLLAGEVPSLSMFFISFSGSLLVALFGFAWFQKTRSGFADII